jgi:translation elongation factor EF-Tu-like GTPase
MVMPGDNIDVTVTLESKTSMRKGEYIKIYESDRLVAVGFITNVKK